MNKAKGGVPERRRPGRRPCPQRSYTDRKKGDTDCIRPGGSLSQEKTEVEAAGSSRGGANV